MVMLEHVSNLETGKNVFCALVLLTSCPRGKPLHRLSLPQNWVHSTLSADGLTAGFLLD